MFRLFYNFQVFSPFLETQSKYTICFLVVDTI